MTIEQLKNKNINRYISINNNIYNTYTILPKIGSSYNFNYIPSYYKLLNKNKIQTKLLPIRQRLPLDINTVKYQLSDINYDTEMSCEERMIDAKRNNLDNSLLKLSILNKLNN